MALLTDDCDMRDTKFWMEHGGNGDYYISLMENTEGFKRLDIRFAMSGGNTNKHLRVRNAIVELYRAMEEAGLNKHPKNDISILPNKVIPQNQIISETEKGNNRDKVRVGEYAINASLMFNPKNQRTLKLILAMISPTSDTSHLTLCHHFFIYDQANAMWNGYNNGCTLPYFALSELL